MGIGGSPEAVLAAAGIKCLGGDMQCKMWPRDEKERKKLIEEGYEKDLDRVYLADDLANGKNIIFCATGISDSALLRGVHSQGRDRHDPLNFDAGEEPNRPIHPRQHDLHRTKRSGCAQPTARPAFNASCSCSRSYSCSITSVSARLLKMARHLRLPLFK